MKTIKVFIVTHGPKCEFIPKYAVPIECGASLRDSFLYDIKDNDKSDNISVKNKDWCELTGLYYIWKHDNHDITGLFHYRRVFKIRERKILRVLKNYDIIASRRIKKTNIRTFACYWCPKSLDAFIEFLEITHIEEYEIAKSILKNHYYYMCQLQICNRKWLESYCEWLFPLLVEFEEYIDDEKKDNRYIGYLAEILCYAIFIQKTNTKVYSMNVASYFGNSIKERIARSSLYCSHLSNIMLNFFREKYYYVSQK